MKESLSQCGNVYSSRTLPFPTVNADRIVAGKAIRSTGELDERREIYVECSPFILTRQTEDLGILNRQFTQNAVPREAGSGDDQILQLEALCSSPSTVTQTRNGQRACVVKGTAADVDGHQRVQICESRLFASPARQDHRPALCEAGGADGQLSQLAEAGDADGVVKVVALQP